MEPCGAALHQVKLRSYQGTRVDPNAPFVSPTLEIFPGDTIRINLNNKLPADPSCAETGGDINIPHCFNGTNLDTRRSLEVRHQQPVRAVAFSPDGKFIATGNMNAISAFSALAENAIPDLFPKLRVGFIETGASWIPFLYADLEAKKLRRTFLPVDFKEDLFRRNRFYVACQTNDGLPYILKYGTEDSLMIGTDYSHADQSAEIDALDVIKERAAKGDISPTVARKILDDNPRRFYGL